MDHGRLGGAIHIKNIWKAKWKWKKVCSRAVGGELDLRDIQGGGWGPQPSTSTSWRIEEVDHQGIRLIIYSPGEGKNPLGFEWWKMWQISWSWLVTVLIMWEIWPWWDFCKTFGKHITVWSVGLDNLENACFILGKEGSNLLASEPLVLNWLGGEYDDGNAPIFY